MKPLLLWAIALLCRFSSLAQNDSVHRLSFKLSLNYHSHLNYYGRTDSLKSTGFFPLAELWIRNKFYVNAAPVFVSNARQTMAYAGTVATAGYLRSSEKWLTGLYFTRPFYKATSPLVQATLKGQAGVSVTRLQKLVNLNIGGDVKFSEQTDWGASAGLDHLIRIDNRDRSAWIVDPSFYTYFGTQRFAHSYTQKQGGLLFLPGREDQVTEQVRRFSVLSYEVAVPIIFVKNGWQLAASPAYTIPQHLVTYADRPELSEQGSNLFYISLSVKRSF